MIGQDETYKKVFTIDENGVCRTDKFGHWISRSPECRITLDGAAPERLVTDIDEEFRSFAWRIAQHETARWSRRGTYLFNQFNPISGRRGSLKEVPNWGEPDGWGIGQIIWAGGSSPHGSGEL